VYVYPRYSDITLRIRRAALRSGLFSLFLGERCSRRRRRGMASRRRASALSKRPRDQRDDGTARANWVADNFINKQSLRQRKMRKAGDDRAEARLPKNKRVQRRKHTVRALAPGKRRLHCRNRMRSSGRTAGMELKYFARE